MKLANFPRLQFGQKEDFTPIGALRAQLLYQGLDLSYPMLMAVSGAAFRHAWMPHQYAGSAALASPEPLIETVIASLGLRAQRLDVSGPDAGWSMVTSLLATGHPVLFWGGARWRTAGLLYGFEQQPAYLWAKTYTDPDDEGRRLPLAAWQQLASEAVEAWVISPKSSTEQIDFFEVLHRALRLMRADADDRHEFGAAAYEAWARTVETAPPALDSDHAAVCFAVVRTLIDARRSASRWLDSLQRPIPSSLINAGDCYTDQLFLLDELAMTFREQVSNGSRLAKQIRAIGMEDARAIGAISATISIVAL